MSSGDALLCRYLSYIRVKGVVRPLPLRCPDFDGIQLLSVPGA